MADNSSFYISFSAVVEDIDTASLKNAKKEIEKELQNSAKIKIEVDQGADLQKQYDNLYKSATKINTKLGNAIKSGATTAKNEWSKALTEVQAKMKNFSIANPTMSPSSDIKAMYNSSSMDTYANAVATMASETLKATNNTKTMGQAIGDAKKKVSAMAPALREQVNELTNVRGAKSALNNQIKSTTAELSTYTNETDKSTKANKGFFDGMNQGLAGAFSGFAIGLQVVQEAIMLLRQGVQKAITDLKDLNLAMTDVQMVAGGTASDMAEMASDYANLAQELGATTVEVAEGSSEWLLIRSFKTSLIAGKPLETFKPQHKHEIWLSVMV